jgi:hypothetical protein
MKPGDRSFDHPAGLAQSATMSDVPMSQDRSDSATPEFLTMRVGVVATITLNARRSAARPTWLATDRRNCFDQRQQLSQIVRIGAGERRGQGNARRIREEVVFAPRFATIGRIRAGFCPPSTARTLELSTTPRDQSMCWLAWSWANSTWCSWSHTPASCQSRSRRQQVMPDPQPISCGSICQGIPVRNTNRMPASASRLPIGGRPPAGDRVTGGSNGSITSHSSSDTNGLAITVLLDRLPCGQTTSR